MRLVLKCPACGRSEDHMCQDERVEWDVFVVDAIAVRDGAQVQEAPTPEEYRRELVTKAAGGEAPRDVLTLVYYDGPQLVVGEVSKRIRREALFVGIASRDVEGGTWWLYYYTGLHGLLCLVTGTTLLEVLRDCGAALPVLVRHDGTREVQEAVAFAAITEAELPAPDATLSKSMIDDLKAFVDARIEALS